MISVKELVQKFKKAMNDNWGYIWGTAGILWTEELQKKIVRQMEVEYGRNWKDSSKAKADHYYQAALNGAKWIGHRVADCSGLFAWAFQALGGSISHGSNSIWRSYCTETGRLEKGRRTDGKQLQPGTAVFTDVNGDKTHIGLYIGNGEVIEASGTKAGVIKSSVENSKWKCWGELKGVSYQDQGKGQDKKPEEMEKHDPDLLPETTKRPTLRKGNKNKYVTQMQTILAGLGYNLGICGIDGDYGTSTEAAVKAFQLDHGLDADGICGPKTWAALDAAQAEEGQKGQEPEEVRYTVTVPGLTLQQAEKICEEWKDASMKKE